MADLGLAALGNLSGLGKIANALKQENITANEDNTGFSSVLTDALDQYQDLEGGNTVETLKLLSGNTDDLSSTMIAAEKAELALNLTISIRNKAISAYNTIMNMQI